MAARYAIYYAPRPETPLGEFGARWLGRDAWTGLAVEQPTLDDVESARLAEVTMSPRHYGFHATLKAPFELRAGVTEEELTLAAAALARRLTAFQLRLRLADLSGFLCLQTAEPSDPLQALVDLCVADLDTFRAPLSAADLERRLSAGLDPKGRDYIERWGYPYVFDRFRFHMTLSGRLPEVELAALYREAEASLGGLLGEPVMVDGIAVFHQPARDEPFSVKSFHEFGGP